MPHVSIILTCYNLGAYLQEALDSLLWQTYSDFEIVLIDDGSTDPETIEVLNRLAPHPRLRIFRTANQGVARARNYGISESRGDYLMYFDADDRLLPTFVERAATILDQKPEVSIVGCYYSTFGEYSVTIKHDNCELPNMLTQNFVTGISLFRRKCWEEVGGYYPEAVYEDWDFWIGVLERGHRVLVIPEVLFEYRIRPNSRNKQNLQSSRYLHALSQLYDRHRTSYELYGRDVLLSQVRLYTEMMEDRNNWQRTAEDADITIKHLQNELSWYKQQLANAKNGIFTSQQTQLKLTQSHSIGSVLRMRYWWCRRQIARIRQIMREQQSIDAQFQAITLWIRRGISWRIQLLVNRYRLRKRS